MLRYKKNLVSRSLFTVLYPKSFIKFLFVMENYTNEREMFEEFDTRKRGSKRKSFCFTTAKKEKVYVVFVQRDKNAQSSNTKGVEDANTDHKSIFFALVRCSRSTPSEPFFFLERP